MRVGLLGKLKLCNKLFKLNFRIRTLVFTVAREHISLGFWYGDNYAPIQNNFEVKPDIIE